MRPKLRNNNNQDWPYMMKTIPRDIISEMAKKITYLFYVGKADISGEEWGDILATGLDGDHLSSPMGLADVIKDGFAWSAKSVKCNNPHNQKNIRVISGRNSPSYSYGITDPTLDVQKTGSAVLKIWNERVRLALRDHDGLRISILLRNMTELKFTYFEITCKTYSIDDYIWKVNARNNLEGFSNKFNNHVFTWQPHGGQFTIKYNIPSYAVNFSIKRAPMLNYADVIKKIKFDDTWVKFHNN